MKKLYGLEDQEILDSCIENTIQKAVDMHVEQVGEGLDVALSRMQFPVKVYVYEPRRVEHKIIERIAEEALMMALESLDQEYCTSDPNGDDTKPDEIQKKASQVFAYCVADRFTPYDAEPTGQVLKYYEADIRELVD